MSDLKTLIELDVEKLAAAEKIYYAALREFNSVKDPIEARQKELLDKFMDAKNEEIEQECCHKPQWWRYAHFTKLGIELRTDADHPNDIREEEFEWEEVQRVLGQVP